MPVFTDPQNALRDKFLAGLGHRRGLWVYGPRQSGTSTYMRSFIDPVYEALMDSPGWVGMDPGNKAVAVELEVKQRKVWSAEAILRANAHDLSLWQETVALTERWDALWNANVLLVDDLVAPDVDFWKKHLLPRLDQRLKGPRSDDRRALGGALAKL